MKGVNNKPIIDVYRTKLDEIKYEGLMGHITTDKPKSYHVDKYDNEIKNGQFPLNNSQFLIRKPPKKTIEMKVDIN